MGKLIRIDFFYLKLYKLKKDFRGMFFSIPKNKLLYTLLLLYLIFVCLNYQDADP